MKKSTCVRRHLAWMTAAVMLLSTVHAAAFSDTAGHWAEETLAAWQEQGRIDGYSDGSFHPDASVTRAGFVKMLNHALGFTAESDISFSDVKETDWFYAEVAKAVAAGYAQGSGGAFRPNQAVTRAEAAVMIARAAGLAANEARADDFADAASIPAWAKGGIGAAAEAGFMNGYSDGAFHADSLITRAQAVVTLDRVLKSAGDTVIEQAGTVLENETVAGDLIIAASAGEGAVTLKNVMVLGNLIIRGGANVDLDGVRAGGTVQLQKENLRLHLSGNTALDRVEITQPCRITRDNSFKGTLGTLVIDLAKTSGREIQIEVPAERVEILSRANVVLGADVERLILGEDAEGTQLAIQRGAAVGRLTADAKVKLTGSGTVSTLEVSVSGVTVDKSLTVKKTETENGAKAPSTASGGSSGGGRSLKVITGAVPVAVRVDYGTDADAALAALPTTVTLNLRDGSTVDATVTAWNWAEQGKYSPTGTAAEYTAEGTFTVPSGCTYSGTPVVKATVTVKPLNMDAFTAALTAAQAKLAGFTEESVAAEATDPDTIYVLPAGTGESDVTNDVKFIFAGNAAYTALKTAVAKAEPYTAGSEKFGSQAACDALTAELTAAADGIGSLAVMTGKNYTDAYIRAQIKKWLDEKKETQKENQADLWAISDAAWPLKYNQEYNRMYQLPQATDAMQVSANGAAAAVALTWTIETSDWDWQKYLEITKDSKTDSVKSVRVTQTPTEPQNITFEVSADGYGDIGTYTVTVGAPIALEAPASPLQFLTSDTRTFQLPLRGASAVKSVPETWGDQALTIAGKIYPEKDLGTISINVAQIDNVEKSKDGKGLDLTVTAATGFVGGAWNPGNNPLACAKGELINISINTSGFKLKTREEGNPGWYLPEALRLDSINVQVLFPVFTEVERAADTDTYNFKIHTENMPLENADIYVAFTLKGNSSNTISGEGTPATYKSNGVYLASFNKTDFKSGQEYSVWCRLGADWVGPEDGGYWFG